MKNNLLILIFIFLFFSGLSKASEFRFVTSEIKILDEGNYIEALNGKAISENNEIVIQGKKFEYQKDLQILKAVNGLHYLNLTILKLSFKRYKSIK